jgi:hypothetical protein
MDLAHVWRAPQLPEAAGRGAERAGAAHHPHGYNGTPKGIRNCFDGGCPRCAGDAASGARLGDCICAHAEGKRHCAAAYHGIAVRAARCIAQSVLPVVRENDYQRGVARRGLRTRVSFLGAGPAPVPRRRRLLPTVPAPRGGFGFPEETR